MTWQDDLQRLDEELAAGRLSTEDYRRQRDELITQISAGQGGRNSRDSGITNQDSGITNRGSGITDQDGGVTHQDSTARPSASPFPPAFRWDPVPSETTQIIQTASGRDAEPAEQTQVVRAPEQPPASRPPDDSELTQVLQAGPPPPSPFERPAKRNDSESPAASEPPPPWAQEESAPPWLVSDMPPIQEPNAGWTTQGPEFFDTEDKEPGTMRIVAMVAAVAVLAGIAFGAWFIWGRETTPHSDPQQTAQQQPAAPGSEEPVEDPLAPVDIGGTRESKQVESFRDLGAVGFLTPEELGALSAAGAADSRLLITNVVQGKATVLVSQVASASQADTARDELAQLQISYGFTPRTAPPGVTSVEVLDKAGTAPTLRAVYASEDRVIRIEMRGNDPATTAAEFEEILNRQLEKLPANA